MPIEPYEVRTQFGAPVRTFDQPKQPRTTLTYAQTCKLERERAAQRDKPALHAGGGTAATLETIADWRDALAAACDRDVTSALAADAWGVSKSAAHSRLIRLYDLGHVTRLPRQRGDRCVVWRIVGAGE